jgi:hypothetical protein
MPTKIWRTIIVIAGLLTAVPSASAQTDDLGDQPAPARLSMAEGPVSFWRQGDQGWSQAQLNMAIEAGDAIYAGDGATVEIQVGPRTFLRLTANTQVSIVRHDAGLLQVSLASGEASLDARDLPQDQMTEIDTANAAFSIDGNGYYRLGFRDGVTRFFVRRSGHATLELSDGYNRTISPGEQVIVRGSEEMTAELAAAPPADSWDRWNDARTDYYDRAVSNRYLPQDVYGAADLDQYGSWSDVPDYGPVWYPSVASDWAPYTVGGWYWDPVYEWTWVSAEPWGWAPSHYGRWVHVGGRWAWAPGPRVRHSVYMPAVVGFVGAGSGPTVGWVALGWGEPIIPWWGHREVRGRPSWGGWGGPHIVNQRVVERQASIDVNTIRFQNSHVSHAVVAVPRDQFGRDHEHRYNFATSKDVRPLPIQGGLPTRHERAPATTAPPALRSMRTPPEAAGVREAAPAPSRGSVTIMPSTREPARRQESRPEARLPAPQVVPRPMIGQPTRPEAQPVEPRNSPIQRHEERPAAQSHRIEIAPAAPRQEAPQTPPHPMIGQPARPEAQPRAAEPRNSPVERFQQRQAQPPRSIEVAPAPRRQEPPAQMPRPSATMPAPAPAREAHGNDAPAAHKAEAPDKSGEGRHRHEPDR